MLNRSIKILILLSFLLTYGISSFATHLMGGSFIYEYLDNAHAQPGDVLILTKPLGTGVTMLAVAKIRPQRRCTCSDGES